MLYLDDAGFVWLRLASIGAILVRERRPHQLKNLLSTGTYRLYDVMDEPELTDEPHLELQVGADVWQGYLLPVGLPDNQKPRRRIIPTEQTITHNPTFTENTRLRQGTITLAKGGAET
jgi:hypothetical protein